LSSFGISWQLLIEAKHMIARKLSFISQETLVSVAGAIFEIEVIQAKFLAPQVFVL